MKKKHTQYYAFSFMLVLLLVNLLSSCAQTKKLVINSHAFFEQRLPGMQRTDQDGKPVPVKPDTVTIVYVETVSKDVLWETAWQNGQQYSFFSQEIVAAPFNAGRSYTEDRKITLFTESGNFLWKLYLIKEPNQKAPPDQPIKGNEILLKGKFKGKPFFKNAGKPVELAPIPAV